MSEVGEVTKLRSEKVPYSDCPVCPKCNRRGIPFYDKNGVVQYGCSMCPWRGIWRFWFAFFPVRFDFSFSFGYCSHCHWDLERKRLFALLNLFGLSLTFNCHSFRDVEGPPENDWRGQLHEQLKEDEDDWPNEIDA